MSIDRKWFKSCTVWGAALFAFGSELSSLGCVEGQELFSAMACYRLGNLLEAAGAILAAVGVRRRLPDGESK